MRTTTRITTLLAVTVALLVAAVGTAQAGTKYVGKAKGGHKITFTKSGNKISKIKTGVPMICTSTESFYGSRSGVEMFDPPGKFTLGREDKKVAKKRSAMWYGEITKNFFVNARSKGRKVKGKVRVSFAYGQPTMDYYGVHLISWYCNGVAKFTASPK